MAAPNIKEIEWAISELENEESSEKSYNLLAALYTCRREMLGASTPQPQISAYSEAAPISGTLDLYGDSDFLRAVASKDAAAVWEVMDELMETLQAVNQRVYDSVMQKLEKI